jgi:outer membrane receptor protein involved in Fe transport
MILRTKILGLITALLSVFTAFAQSGAISGTVKDGATGEGLIGATVLIKGTTQGASTDFEGNFTIKDVKAGSYVLDVSYISYKTKSVPQVMVLAGKTTSLDLTLDSDNQLITEVEVSAKRRTGTEMSVLTEVKKAEQVAVGVSATQIAKTQDRDAGAVIRRVPGVSIIDGRFVMIRGLNERYNTVMLNDVITPSLEVDKKSFSFDLIPSAMIDRMLVFKSGSADLPAEYAGGIIKIYTKNLPDENFVSITLQGGYRNGTTFEEAPLNQQKGAGLGFSSANDLPSVFPARITSAMPVSTFRSLPNDWSYETGRNHPDLRANLAFGRKFRLGKAEAGNLTSITYSNVFQYFPETVRNRYESFDSATQRSGNFFHYVDRQNINTVNIGVLSNFNFILSPKTRLDFRNFFNQNGRNETTLRTGSIRADGQDFRNYAFRYEQRSIYSGQVGSVHNLNDRDELRFNIGYGLTKRQEPDFKRVRSSRQSDTQDPYQIYIPGSATTYDAARFFSNLDETSVVVNGAWDRKLGEITDGERFQEKLKTGFYFENKNRVSQARWMSYKVANYANFNQDLLKLPADQIFAPENISPTGFTLEEGTNPSDYYEASNLQAAGYISYGRPIGERLSVVAGIRGEFNRQQLTSSKLGGQPVKVDNPIFTPVPSLNITCNLGQKQVLRLAYSYSVNRPEFRELAPFQYYSFAQEVNITGNPDLKIARIHNLDARWELYPSPSELVSFGVFRKNFTNPIENYIQPGSGSNISYRAGNAAKAVNYGLEAEVRKNLEDVFKAGFLQKVSVLFNASLIKSRIVLGAGAENQVSERPMQGQSPYLVNAGFYYNDNDNGLQVSILYNVFGKRIYVVGDIDANPDQYEMPRHLIDISFTKRAGRNFEIKGGVTDLLNQPYRLIQDSDHNGKVNGTDQDIQRYRFGSYFSLGFTYRFN